MKHNLSPANSNNTEASILEPPKEYEHNTTVGIDNYDGGVPQTEAERKGNLARPIGRVVLLSPMSTEAKPFIDAFAMQQIGEDPDLPSLWAVPFPVYKVDGRDLYLVLTNTGMVNAGIAAGISLSVLQPDLALNVGCAGASSPHKDVHKGHIILPKELFNLGAWCTRPREGEPTSDATQWTHSYGPLDYQHSEENLGSPYILAPDSSINTMLASIVDEMGLPYHCGALGSSDMVITDPQFLDHIRCHTLEELGLAPDAERKMFADAETYPIAQACHILNENLKGRFILKFGAIRFVTSSDYYDEPYDPDSVEQLARQTIVPVVHTLLQRLGV